MKKITCVFFLCLVLMMSGSVSASASEGTGFMWELLKTEAPMNMEYGETVTLADTLEFSIPADWERSFEYDDEEMCSFLFKGEDEEGRNIMFLGIEADSLDLGMEFSSYTDIKNKLVEAETSYILSSLNGIDMVFAGDDDFTVGMCLMQDGAFVAFGFGSDDYDLSEIRQSEKLKKDMIAILHSVQVSNADTLMSFDADIWEGSGRTDEPKAIDTPVKTPGERSAQELFFEGVTSGNGVIPMTHPIYLDRTLVVYVPDDWCEIKDDDSICTFIGIDDEENIVTVAIDAVQTERMTIDDLEADAKEQIACCTIDANGIRYFTVLTKSSLVTAWLADDGTVYRLSAYLDSEGGMRSEKLIGDLHQIMCRLRPVHDGELEQNDTATMLARSDHPDEEPVSFSNAEFERMVRTAMGRGEEDPVYSSELEAIRCLSIRSGKLLFSPEIQSAVSYNQPCVLDLSDLSLFPNLIFLDITDMKCSGFEKLAELPELRQLILIRTGLTDCSFLTGMELTELNLAGNDISDFAPIAMVKGLEKLNVSDTGLDTLDYFRGMDLTMLVAANNPVSDLTPVSNMSGLTSLYIQNTDAATLNALRNLTDLEELNISGLSGEISLEPLYGHEKLKRIYCWGVSLSDEDRQRYKDIMW